MNHVERFRAVADFQLADRLPRIEWAMWWNKTIERWKSEGLPRGLKDTNEIIDYFGLDPYKQFWVNPVGAATDAVASQADGGVVTMDDYRAVRGHLFPEHSFEEMAPWAARQREGEVVVWITLDGFFWFPRKLLGIERHLYSFYDSPELMHCINEDLAAYHVRTLKRIAAVCRPVFMTFAEDMSYNHGPMLSKAMFDEFLAPYYRRVTPVLEELQTVPLIDTDGDVSRLVPWLLKVGIRGVLPLERQAGVDAATLRRDAPRLMMIGHFDKMVMNQGEAAIRGEFERLLPTMRRGGFIPSVDHQTPPGVSLEQYRVYLKLLDEYMRLGSAR